MLLFPKITQSPLRVIVEYWGNTLYFRLSKNQERANNKHAHNKFHQIKAQSYEWWGSSLATHINSKIYIETCLKTAQGLQRDLGGSYLLKDQEASWNIICLEEKRVGTRVSTPRQWDSDKGL